MSLLIVNRSLWEPEGIALLVPRIISQDCSIPLYIEAIREENEMHEGAYK